MKPDGNERSAKGGTPVRGCMALGGGMQGDAVRGRRRGSGLAEVACAAGGALTICGNLL